ncbi:MAG: hypothetical protein ABJC13_01475 [Acidobacteriota bacterium]
MSELLRDPDLDRLVEQLNQNREKPAAAPGGDASRLVPARLSRVDEGEPLEALLSEMARRGASGLVRSQVVTLEEARVRSPHPDELASLLAR